MSNTPERSAKRRNKNKKKTGILILAGVLAVVVLVIVIVVISERPDEDHVHVYSRTVIEEATCDKEGLAEYYCLGCNDKYKEAIPRIAHKISGNEKGDGRIHTGKCTVCGKEVQIMFNKNTGVRFSAPVKTRGKTAAATVVNSEGFTYNYTMYLQGAGYNSWSHYMKHHGCSNCAMTSLLNAVSPELKDYTPDRMVEEVQHDVLGSKAFWKNYNKDRNKGSMPITLYGMTKIFDEYGVKYKLPSSDSSKSEEEITEHLRNGNPVIITFAKGGAKGLSNSIHTILLIGIDEDGYVIIGDSLHKKSKHWGKQGLVKTGKITVHDMVSYITTYGDWTVLEENIGSGGDVFYHGRTGKGYLLVYGENGK